jgi:hypothetical protein
MLNFGNQFPFRILFRILSVIVVNCNLIISVMVAWPNKFTEGSQPGKKHPLPIDLSTENKKAKRSAYHEKNRRQGRSFNQKWKDGRHWLSYNESENVMKCSVPSMHG